MSHRGRRVQTSASREADCAVPCSWTQSSETRDGWINTMRKTACSQLLPLQCWNENAFLAQSCEHKEDITTADFNRGKGRSATQNWFSSPQERETKTKRCFDLSCYGRKNNPTLVQHTLPSEPTAKKIQTCKTEHKIVISARDIKQYKLWHMAITHTRAHKLFLQSLEPLWILLQMQHLERSPQEGRIRSFAGPKL